MIVTQAWIPKSKDVVFTGAAPIVPASAADPVPLITLPVHAALIRAFCCYVLLTDPLVAGGGATGLLIGLRRTTGGGAATNLVDMFETAAGLGVANTGIVLGVDTKYTNPPRYPVPVGTTSQGNLIYPAAYADAGTITGTLRVFWQEQPVSWANF